MFQNLNLLAFSFWWHLQLSGSLLNFSYSFDRLCWLKIFSITVTIVFLQQNLFIPLHSVGNSFMSPMCPRMQLVKYNFRRPDPSKFNKTEWHCYNVFTHRWLNLLYSLSGLCNRLILPTLHYLTLNISFAFSRSWQESWDCLRFHNFFFMKDHYLCFSALEWYIYITQVIE